MASVLPSGCCCTGISERSLTSFDRDSSHDAMPAMVEINLCPPALGDSAAMALGGKLDYQACLRSSDNHLTAHLMSRHSPSLTSFHNSRALLMIREVVCQPCLNYSTWEPLDDMVDIALADVDMILKGCDGRSWFNNISFVEFKCGSTSSLSKTTSKIIFCAG